MVQIPLALRVVGVEPPHDEHAVAMRGEPLARLDIPLFGHVLLRRGRPRRCRQKSARQRDCGGDVAKTLSFHYVNLLVGRVSQWSRPEETRFPETRPQRAGTEDYLRKIVIGGGVSRNPRLLQDLQEEYDKAAEMVEPFGMPHAELALCHYTSDANLVGALYNWKLHYE